MTDRTALVTFKPIMGGIVAAPADHHSLELFQQAKPDTVYRIIPKRSRNPKFHRKCMRLIQDCFENQEHYEHFESFREAMKIECGWVEFTTTTVRESVLAKYCLHHSDCYFFVHGEADDPCTCGLDQALEADRIATHIKTKSQSFDECSEEEAAELWERIKTWAVKYLGHEAVNSYEGGW